MNIVLQPTGKPLGQILNDALTGKWGEFTSFSAAIAFMQRSGIKHIETHLKEFLAQGGHVKLIVGIDQKGTSFEALESLLAILATNGEVWINHDVRPYITFHPKLFFFEGQGLALLIVGSGNLTQGGLYTNDEAALLVLLQRDDEEHWQVWQQVSDTLELWSDETLDNVRRLDSELLHLLVSKGYVEHEGVAPTLEASELNINMTPVESMAALFGKGLPRSIQPAVTDAALAVPTSLGHIAGFVMTLMKIDVSYGQESPGTSRRSPEIFVPLSARDFNPAFWDWPDSFTEDETMPGKFDRPNVPMLFRGKTIYVNMMTWPIKHDFRLRNEQLRGAGTIGDILKIEQAGNDEAHEYNVEVVEQGTPAHKYYLSLCTEETPNSPRIWGYYVVTGGF